MTNLEQWQAQGKTLAEQHTTQKWLIADWLAAGDTQWGGTAYDEATRLFPDLSRKYLIQLAYTARNVGDTVRQYKLSFTHHELVAGLEPAKQDRWLKKAAEEKMTCGDLRRVLSSGERDCSLTISGPLFRELDEFSKLVSVTPSVLVAAAVKQFLQQPPAELKTKYETEVLAQRQRVEQEKAEYLVRKAKWDAEHAAKQKVYEERQAFLQKLTAELNPHRTAMHVSGTPLKEEAERMAALLHSDPPAELTVLQEQLDKVLALCKPPEPAPDTEEALVAAD